MSYYFDRLCENCEYRLENGECVVTEDGGCINAEECDSFLQKE